MKDLTFIVHKHIAKTPHYDLRLEINGKWVSWSIPKGPTLDPTIKRLSIHIAETPDLDDQFTGLIKEEKYGDGLVEVFDRGTYITEIEISKGVRKEIKDSDEGEKIQAKGLEKGEIKFILKGKKLKGSFALVKTKGFPPGVKNAWLLIKHKDKYAKEGYDAKAY